MNDNATNDGRIDRRTYLEIAGTGILAAGVAGCLGLGGIPSSQNERDIASFDCSQVLETKPYSRDEPTFSFQFIVPKNMEVVAAKEYESGARFVIGNNVADDINNIIAAGHNITIDEDRDFWERKNFVKFYSKNGGCEKLSPRPYGSGEMVVLYADGKSIQDHKKEVRYTWLLGLPTDTDGQIRITRIFGYAGKIWQDTVPDEVPFCNEAIKKTTEKIVNSIRPK